MKKLQTLLIAVLCFTSISVFAQQKANAVLNLQKHTKSIITPFIS